ncbi:nicotinamidase-related amidase [Amycolatopsis lexingtonensis]|uniref:Nicotinamidase-related amidase n=1 Tax=Amycolatopsis lexingtonensis TaxID=218822 RepID=A0ABR9HT75_9PSEU|nr:isochorismatase family protein [Amycolatopsis lexingtonensis]MBE1494121.1 nicotinamidase-related amidase [Amycolatopsis lexingtonensis]
MSSSETVEAAMARLLAGLGSGRRHGPGRRPAVVVVDLQRHFIDADPGVSGAVVATAGLLDHARRAAVPVYLVRIGFDDLADADPAWAARFDLSPLLRGAPGTAFDPRIGPREGDVVVDKRHASAFAGTDLGTRLSEKDIDTVLLCGLTTSGCVRATAVDAASLGLRVEIVLPCVADPRPLSGPVALADLADRYADVISLDEAVRLLAAAA